MDDKTRLHFKKMDVSCLLVRTKNLVVLPEDLEVHINGLIFNVKLVEGSQCPYEYNYYNIQVYMINLVNTLMHSLVNDRKKGRVLLLEKLIEFVLRRRHKIR